MKILSKLFVVAIVITLGSSFSSCKKECVECTSSLTDAITYCEADFPSKTEYEATIALFESFNGAGTCTKK